jgi:hypothetical protein
MLGAFAESERPFNPELACQVLSDLFTPYTWACFEPRLRVRGVHSPEKLPIAPPLRAAFEAGHPRVLEEVLARPEGFDGRRAALTRWEHHPGELQLRTGERSYTEGLVLGRLIRERRRPPPDAAPDPAWSWGTTLATLVLLPERRVLVGQRSEQLQSAPGRWAAVFTEVLEPADIDPLGMRAVLDRLVAEELAPLRQLGRHEFVGLLRLAGNWEWILVAVLDLRGLCAAALAQALARLVPDDETVAWDTLPLDEAGDDRAGDVIGLQLARDVQARLPPA